MLKENKYFQLFWSISEYFGLRPHKLDRKQKIRAFMYFSFLVVPNLILYILEFFISDDAETKFYALQTFPYFVTLYFEAAIIVMKSREIEEIFGEIYELSSENANKVYFEKGLKLFLPYAYIENVLTMTSGIVGIFILGITGKSPVLIYKPAENGIGFFLILLLQSLFFFYGTFVTPILDQTFISLLMFLSFQVKALRSRLRSFSLKDAKDKKEIIELQLKVKR